MEGRDGRGRLGRVETNNSRPSCYHSATPYAAGGRYRRHTRKETDVSENGADKKEPVKGITSIFVSGYKSIAEPREISIRRLTLLCGANSSGKSSILQPLLLLKQTLDAPYDPGALRISGPNVAFTRIDQFLSRIAGEPPCKEFSIRIEVDREHKIRVNYRKDPEEKILITKLDISRNGKTRTLTPNMRRKSIEKILAEILPDVGQFLKKRKLKVERQRCFLGIHVSTSVRTGEIGPGFSFSPAGELLSLIPAIIHVPGLRGNPERTYRTTAVQDEFPGIFSDYVASIIQSWQIDNDDRLINLGEYLKKLNLTWRVDAKAIDDTRVEVRVGRTPKARRGGAHDMVSIADVGFGVSQTLPVLVALLTAKQNQLVYIEQPELHLHPLAQVRLAELLVEAANRGVRLVVETHSSIILLTIQSLVAEGNIEPECVALHWFERRASDGVTEITSAPIDKEGAFGDWPVDFGDIELESQSRFLDAYEKIRKTA